MNGKGTTQTIKPAHHAERSLRFVLMSKNHNPMSRLAEAIDSDLRTTMHQLLLIRQMCLCVRYQFRYQRSTLGRQPSIALWSTPEPERQAAIVDVLNYLPVRQYVQHGEHLGERMSHALQDDSWPYPVEDQLMFGIDSLQWDLSFMRSCLRGLEQYPWSFVATNDGGFIACAVRSDSQQGSTPTSPEVAFAQTQWGHTDVYSDITGRLDDGEHHCSATIDDIDTGKDLYRERTNATLLRACYLAARCIDAARTGVDLLDFLQSLEEENFDLVSPSMIQLRLQTLFLQFDDEQLSVNLFRLLGGLIPPKS